MRWGTGRMHGGEKYTRFFSQKLKEKDDMRVMSANRGILLKFILKKQLVFLSSPKEGGIEICGCTSCICFLHNGLQLFGNFQQLFFTT
jgi:hypothetical protein